jgi:hypothetical protein
MGKQQCMMNDILHTIWHTLIHILTTLFCVFPFTDAPTVTVSDTTFDTNEPTRTLACIPDGNPQSYSFYEWQHKSKYGVLIRKLDGGQNGVLTLPSISVEDRYQDSGEYVCTAGNGIVGRDGRVKQTGFGYVIINGM